jgi:glycosyltransferase involved in cell wall biosynthesis
MLQMQMLRRWSRSIDCIVTPSFALKSRLEEYGLREVKVIPLGVPVRPPRPPLRGPGVIAFAGRLVPEKGVDVLLQAFHRVLPHVPDVRLQIAGDGPSAPSLRALAANLGLSDRVVFLGKISRDEMECRFQHAWLQAVPSVWEEPFGLVAAEAAMRGTAAVASDTGGLPEIVIRNKTGLLVPPRDVAGLAEAMQQLLLNQSFAEELGANARVEAKRRFSLERYADRLSDVYEQLANLPVCVPPLPGAV